MMAEKNRVDKGIEKGGMDSSILQISVFCYREFSGSDC